MFLDLDFLEAQFCNLEVASYAQNTKIKKVETVSSAWLIY